MSNPVPVKTAKTVLEVIETLVALEEAQFGELVEQLDMPSSTVHDHLNTLEELDLVTTSDGVYRPGLRFLDIGERVRRQRKIYRAGVSQVDQLASETGEYASLMIEENGRGVLLYVSKGEQAVELNAWSGRHLDLSTNAPGKTILAHLPSAEVAEILTEHGLPAYTPSTITDREELLAELEEIRQQGYGTETGELVEGVRAVAAPVVSQNQIRGAIAIGGPQNRMRGERFEQELPDRLLQASNVVELNLSYN